MSKYLYGASVQGIQNFIFTTNELKSIVGASEIVKSINDEIEKSYSKNIMINAAGNVRLVFDENEKKILEKLVLEFPKSIIQKAFGISVSQAVVKFDNNLKDAISELEKRLFIQRNKPSLPIDLSINIMKLAPKTAKPLVDGEKDKATIQKESCVPNDTKGSIPKNRKNKTAVIHIDGNSLGILIANLTKDKKESELIKTYTNFSKNLDKATKEAFDEVTKNYNKKEIRRVIVGGDDVTVICNANIALEFTKNFLKEFETKTSKYLKNSLTACAGIAFCNHKYPFHYAVNLAESLCSYSKKHSKLIDETNPPSSLMFHNIQSSNFDSFDDYIDNELVLKNEKEKIHLNYGPYFINSMNNYSSIDDFLNLSNAFLTKGSPISRLRDWLTILSQNSTHAQERLERINDILNLRDDIFRVDSLNNGLNRVHQNLSMRNLIIERDGKKYTPIGDVVTYLSVIDGKKGKK